MLTRDPEARSLFGGIAARYDAPAEALSFGQYARWRGALVDALRLDRSALALDVATGTGLIARLIARRYECAVVGVDLTEAMLRRADGVTRAAADANALPFDEGVFDALTFSYLFRYVDDPHATMRELVRVVQSGGIVASVEFGLPRAPWARAGWRAYARGMFPVLARAVSPGWREVGGFLPGNIEQWARAWPIERQVDMWRAAGIDDIRVREMTFGTAVLIKGRKR